MRIKVFRLTRSSEITKCFDAIELVVPVGIKIMKKRILCIGAHPDDVEIAMGGTVCALVEKGHEVLLLDLTDGEPTPNGSRDIRLAESQKAAECLGVRRVTLDMPNRWLVDSTENRKKASDVAENFGPDLIFALYPEDGHPDHVAASALSRFAAFCAAGSHESIPLVYFSALHLRMPLKPSLIVDISLYLDRKVEALRCYASQFLRPGKSSIERIVVENTYWGNLSGYRAGEAFYQGDRLELRTLGI